jgi:hypothetical protein
MERIHLSQNLLYLAIFVGLIGIFLFLTIGSVVIGQKSLTYDEPQHFRYGEQILELNSERFIDSTMPFSVLNVISSRLAESVLGTRLESIWQVMSVGRISTILFSLGVGIIVLGWAQSLYNKWIGLIAFGLYVFEPNIIAHSRLITTDIYAVGTITLTLFLFWRFLEKPVFGRGLLASLALGLSQIAKYTGLFLFPLLLILYIVRYWEWIISKLRQKLFRELWQAFQRFLLYGFLFLIISLLIINVGFLFNRTGIALGDYDFRSNILNSLQGLSGLLRRIPIPLPYPYLEGLDLVLMHERIGGSYGAIFMLGELRQGEGFPGYFLVATQFKMPIAILALIILAVVDVLKLLIKRELPQGQIYLLIPIIFFTIYFNFFFRAQIGIRFFLVVFPILLIFCVQIFQKWVRLSRGSRIGLILAGIYLIGSVASYFPHYLSYFNELVLDRTFAYRILADSNLDWGQNKAVLDEFLEEHPEYIFEPDEPTSGLILVGVNEFTGVLGSSKTFKWLRDNFEPVDHLYYTYLIFDIHPSEIEDISNDIF